MRVLAITSRAPYSTAEEAFAQDEIEALRQRGLEFLVVPMRITGRRPNAQSISSGLINDVVAQPLFSPAVALGALRTLWLRPGRSIRAVAAILLKSGGRRNLATNLAASAKALWIAQVARERGATHIHAYWLGHTASAAYIASRITGIPWSGTGYRWDIAASNALRTKSRSAAFLRVADELGQGQLRQITATVPAAAPIELVRTGVTFPRAVDEVDVVSSTICCAAAFVPKKGHTYLFQALEQLRARGRRVQLELIGDGPLREHLEREIHESGLAEQVTMLGELPLDALRQRLAGRRPIFVLPSITADDGQQEGIPVVLIEAMAAGCPVITTRSGSIPSLVLDGCGWLVAERDAAALADALFEAQGDLDEARRRAQAGRARVEGEFDIQSTSGRMADLLRAVSRPG